MEKYLKVMFGTKSGASSDLEYKIDEVNIAKKWNPNTYDPKEMGGFNFSREDKILRWLIRGDTIYDVEVPEDAEIIDCPSESAPHGVFRSNKIILRNPRVVTDELAMDFYKKSKLPEKSYFKAMAGCVIRGYVNTAMQIFRDKINKDNIELAISQYEDFMAPKEKEFNIEELNDIEKDFYQMLQEIKSDLLISINVSKNIYEKIITDDKIINITGESGSGKSTYSERYLKDENYIVIDTDEIYGRPTNNKNCVEFAKFLNQKYGENLPDNCENFNVLYKEILDYYKDTNKYLVIDSAQFRNLRRKEDLELLKGKIIIVRTCVDECYNRVIERWKKIKQNVNNGYSEEELEKYKTRKFGMYKWYKSLNVFIDNIDKI